MTGAFVRDSTSSAISWGTLETVLRLPLRNVSRGGALIHSHVPLPSQSVHRLAFRADGQDLTVPVRVSHVDTQVSADGERTYLIGVEFLAAQPAAARVRRADVRLATARRRGFDDGTGYTTERRHTPASRTRRRIECRLDLRTRVRLMDISLSGALLAAELPLPAGASAELRSGLGCGSFRAGRAGEANRVGSQPACR